MCYYLELYKKEGKNTLIERKHNIYGIFWSRLVKLIYPNNKKESGMTCTSWNGGYYKNWRKSTYFYYQYYDEEKRT